MNLLLVTGDTLFRLSKVYRRRTGRLGIRRRRRSTLYSKSWSTSGGSFSTGTLSHRSETISEHVHVSCVVGLEVNLRGREVRKKINRVRHYFGESLLFVWWLDRIRPTGEEKKGVGRGGETRRNNEPDYFCRSNYGTVLSCVVDISTPGERRVLLGGH